jgi:pimeloyl-ACP methyl ester carboxylesterase
VPAALPVIDPATLATFYGQKLAWSSCSGGFQCATLTVPLDYAHPASGSIKLAVIRRTTSSSSRIGSVVLNPGGPGASGIAYARSAARVIGTELGNRFDVVSFDPRGVGQSDPIRCLTAAQLDVSLAFEADPNNPAQVGRQGLLAKQFADGCEAKSGALLAHVSTVETARDLDVLRAALGDSKLTYIGASYGTFLGALYAQLFPTHVRALVLDGALDPSASAAELNSVQAQGFELALKSFIAWCVRSSSCPLGRSATAAEPKLDAWLALPSTNRLRTPAGRSLSTAIALSGIAAALYSPTTWAQLRSALEEGFAGNPSGLIALSDDLNGRQSDGTYNNLVESNTAISCVDRPGPTGGIDAYAALAKAGLTDGPTFGEYIGWGDTACAAWPVAPELAPGPVSAVGSPPILVIGTLRDPATPYRWAQALAAELKGPLLTFDGDGHTANLRSSCVDRAVSSYLGSLRVPKAGTVCH